MLLSLQEQRLCQLLKNHPKRFKYRYTPSASRALLVALFRSLAGSNDQYLPLFFPEGPPQELTEKWELRRAQGAIEGAEYTAAARGKPCGHIFKSGEATYRCKTCSLDDTCVLCSRCFDSSDHTGHMVYVSVSPGNSGCCDCGDLEAWRMPVNCAIHTATDEQVDSKNAQPAQAARLPDELMEGIRMTIGRAVDYVCDVISCSPEQLRLPKTEDGIRLDEKGSRLTHKWYDEGEDVNEATEYCLVLWNDEKHTVPEVQNQVARACKIPRKEALRRAEETNDMGRSIISYSTDLDLLLQKAKVVEQIKVTVTIRSSRDTYREQMCGTIIEWLNDIAGCSVGDNHHFLRQTICEEMLKLWRTGSEASNAEIGRSGIDDHEKDDAAQMRRLAIAHSIHVRNLTAAGDDDDDEEDDDEDDDEVEEDEDVDDDEIDVDDEMELDLDVLAGADQDGDLDMDTLSEQADDDLEADEATHAGYPRPPPPPPPPPRPRGQGHTPAEFEAEDGVSALPLLPGSHIPRTPATKSRPPYYRPPRYWLEEPAGYIRRESVPIYEDLWQRVRLDWMILYDLRMWKKARVDLRDLYITTVVTIPQFKRILGLRFAGLYTTLAQLYLIADREPDHSIINLSLQMLTTPSITDEVVERGNFLTNLMAILYTFLTTRQVGHPQNVRPDATLAFDTGSVTNRRMYHFFMDLKYLFGSEHVQEKLRKQERYVLQFLDLVKLHQGICPNLRAVGEHVEYETDAWISASLITREVNKLCRQFAESFKWKTGEDDTSITRAIRLAASAAIVNSLGAERKRFDQAELKSETRFKSFGCFDLDRDDSGQSVEYRVVDFVVEKQSISFHHALHYTLSWLIDYGKSMSRNKLRDLLLFTPKSLRESLGLKVTFAEHEPEDYLMAMFDLPIRVCAWLAQMKTGMWVRNGLSLRHQMSTYRNVSQRDVAHHRDIFLIQSALVICDPSRVLASIIDRFGMEDWVRGKYGIREGYEDTQMVDVAEDFIHLMIVLLCDRTSLMPIEDEHNTQALAIKRDIAHVLCFKPVSFSDICARLADKFQDLEEFQDILEEMTNYRPPEGLSDSGTFELKAEFIDDIDPYIAHYTKNQREEAENAYRVRMAKRTGKPASDIVYEPKLRPIQSGTFLELVSFTRTPLFAQVILSLLGYALQARNWTPNIPDTRVETFVQVVLHLTLIAILEDNSDEDDMSEESLQSFVHLALSRSIEVGIVPATEGSILQILQKLSLLDEFKACHLKIKLILRRLQQKRPRTYRSAATTTLGEPLDRCDTESPATFAAEDAGIRKKQALDRQAKVMAQFQQQQKNFLANQGEIDWGDDDFSDLDSEIDANAGKQRKVWKYPTGTCILCQEETNDSRLYGTFALVTESNILRQTDHNDPQFLAEASITPSNLDRSAEDIRPFGLSGQNRSMVRRLTSNGSELVAERQGLGKGFPPSSVKRGPVTIGCGHIMHYSCFELYYGATQRRQAHQVPRNHPERLALKEFVCPLCKALGNAFLPIIWRSKEEVYPGVLESESQFDDWLSHRMGPAVSRLEKGKSDNWHDKQSNPRYQESFINYSSRIFIAPLASKVEQLIRSGSTAPVLSQVPTLSQAPRHHMPGIFPADDPTAAYLDGSFEQGSLTTLKLVDIYKRLRDTIKVNQLPSRYTYPANTGIFHDLTYSDTLAQTLGFSIAAAEIARRGVGCEPGSTLLSSISSQTITHLRILSETVSSYIAVGGLRNDGQNSTINEYNETQSRQLHQLFMGHPQIVDQHAFPSEVKQLDPLMNRDVFVFLVESSVCLVPALRLDIHHILRLCYLAEIVKVFLTFLSEPGQHLSLTLVGKQLAEWQAGKDLTNEDSYNEEQIFRCFLDRIQYMFNIALQELKGEPQTGEASVGWDKYTTSNLQTFRKLVTRYALPFLRKSVILLHVRYGVDFPLDFSNVDEPELDRLTKALKLQSLDEIFSTFSSNFDTNPVLQSIVHGWIRHWVWIKEGKSQRQQSRAVLSLSHPTILELVGLPKNFDVLTEETMKRRCPTTGKELTDPSICLFCGDIFCSQAYCCTSTRGTDKVGGCNQHVEKYVNLKTQLIFSLI
ncbi:MAG: hypothetical protein M1812_002817 [Candelaria pacifica]|nr:MAG: hypothetical protein M1812_002817 [Candelaria pacifica]